MSGDELLLAIDLGTTGAKVGLFNARGEMLSMGRRSYGFQHPGGRHDWLEQDAEEWWLAVREAAREALAGQPVRRIRAVCPGGQGPTLVLVDERSVPVRPAISWLDSRAEPQRARISERLGYQLQPYSLVPILAWVAEHEPGVYERARWALQAWDFIGLRLAGVAATSTFAGSPVWQADWVAAAGLATGRLPHEVAAGTAYAATSGAWADEIGLLPGVAVVGSMNDGTGSMVGAAGGVVGRATDTGGHSGGLAVCWDQPLAAPGVACWPGFVPHTYLLGGAFAAAGRAVDWWAGIAGLSVPHALELASSAPPGGHGLVFLPFLVGERAPYWDPSARGAFLGLTDKHQPSDLARAVVESSGYSLRLLTDAIVNAGGRIDELRVCGAQARSRFWSQVKADVTGLTVSVPRVTEVALMGNAIFAAIGAGLYPDVDVAAEAMVRVATQLPVDARRHAVYTELFAVYGAGYAALQPFFAPLARAAAVSEAEGRPHAAGSAAPRAT